MKLTKGIHTQYLIETAIVFEGAIPSKVAKFLKIAPKTEKYIFAQRQKLGCKTE